MTFIFIAIAWENWGLPPLLPIAEYGARSELAEEIKAGGGRAEAAKVDALNKTEVDNYLQKIVMDNSKLDAVFNGIGMSYSDAGPGGINKI